MPQPDQVASLAAPTAADPRRWKALGVLALIQFMLSLDITVVNIALPQMQRDLGFSSTGLAWVVNAYVLMAGGLLLLGGRTADFVGRRKMFLIGVGPLRCRLSGLRGCYRSAAARRGPLRAGQR